MASSSNSFHESLEQLTSRTRDMHRALVSMQEELEAVDWYRQRADACDNGELREILLHNAREEVEHMSMLLEWIRRNDPDFNEQLTTYLFTDKPVLAVEEEAEAEGDGETAAVSAPQPTGLTIGSMKGA